MRPPDPDYDPEIDGAESDMGCLLFVISMLVAAIIVVLVAKRII